MKKNAWRHLYFVPNHPPFHQHAGNYYLFMSYNAIESMAIWKMLRMTNLAVRVCQAAGSRWSGPDTAPGGELRTSTARGRGLTGSLLGSLFLQINSFTFPL